MSEPASEDSAGSRATVAASRGADATELDPDARSPAFREAVREGVVWSVISLVAKQAGRALMSIVLARLIGPTNYGIVGQATVYIMLTTFLLDGGFGAAFIQKERVDRRDEGSVYWITGAATSVMVLTTLLVAPALAAFFRTPELTAVVRVLALDVLLLGLAGAPTAILSRRMRFRALGSAQVVGVVVGGAAGIVAAVMGAEYWSLVVFYLANDLVVFVGVAAVAGRPRLQTSRSSLRRMWSFGVRVMSAQLLYYTMRVADNVLVGRFLGATALGYYAVSYRVLMLPQQTLGYVVNRVSFPVFSRLQDDRAEMGRYFLRATRLVAFATLPAMTMVLACAPMGVPAVFGAQWQPAATTMQVLAVAGLVSSLQHLARPVLYAAGKQGLALRVQTVLTISSIVAFAVGLRWGITGVAAGVAVVLWTLGPVLVRFAAREMHLTLRDYAAALVPVGASCVALLAALVPVLVVLERAGMPDMVTLAAASMAGLGSYLLCLRLVWPAELSDAIRSAKLLLRPARLAAVVGPGGRRGRAPEVAGAG